MPKEQLAILTQSWHSPRMRSLAEVPATPDAARTFLSHTGWLATVPEELRSEMLRDGRVRDIQAGELFNFAGDENAGMWGLAAGQAATTSGVNGPDSPIALLEQPGYWGGQAPLFGRPRLANVHARTEATILFVPYQSLRQMLAAHPSWWEHFGRLAFDHVHRYAMLAVDLMLAETRARTAAILLHQGACRAAGNTPVTLHLSQQELGEMTNLSRHPIGSLLREFEADGLIRLGYRQITLLQPATLRAIAG
jgi:CRP/FNR family cyclic AMP-dependent transcriptional regulator